MKIAIYQTSDIHGNIFPTNYIKDTNEGLLKIASFIDDDSKNYDCILKVDCGDFIQGSPFSDFLSKEIHSGEILMDLMKEINYNAIILGNHDFNYGPDYIEKTYKTVEERVINANIKGLPIKTKPYQIYDCNGIKIAIIGFTTSYIPNWEQPNYIKNMEFLNPVDTYAKYEKELEELADYIVVAYHGGMECSLEDNITPTEKQTKENQGSELLRNFKSIDILLGGHQHRSFVAKVDNRICTQPLNNGKNFARVVIDTDTKEINADLINIADEEVAINSEYENTVNKYNNQLDEFLNRQVGELNADLIVNDLFDARLRGHPYINLLHKIQLYFSKADISVVSLFDSTTGLNKNISMKDIIVNYPYPNTLKVLKVSGKQLKSAIEKAASYFVIDNDEVVISEKFLIPKKQNYNYDMFYGVDYEVDLRKPIGDRVIKLTYKGKNVNVDDEFNVVMNNYRATNTSVYTAYENCEVVKEINNEMNELMIEFFLQNPKVKIDNTRNYKFVF